MDGREPPDFASARNQVVRQVVRFERTLRANGASVPAGSALSATAALSEVGLRDRDRVEVAMRTTLLTDPRDRETFDAHFPAFWYRLRTGLEATATLDELDPGQRGASGRAPGEPDATPGDGEAAETGGEEGADAAGRREVRARRVAEGTGQSDALEPLGDGTRPGTYSAAGEGETIEGESAAGAEGSVDQAAVRRLVEALATLPGRRWRAGAGDRIDARRALRRSLSTGGVAVRLPGRSRDPRAFRACVLVDVSRSVLDALDRGFLLSFVDALVDEGREVRVFFFDTEIREVTDALDRGMVWLSRRAASVVWFNPLAASGAYEPTCRGMAAALPYVDGLFALAGSTDVDEAARQLSRHGVGGPVGYEHDFRERGDVEERGGVGERGGATG